MPFKNKEKFVMSGKFYFLDTNTIIQLLKGNQELVEILSKAEFIACSVISKLEYLSFPNLSENDIELFNTFAEKIEIMDLSSNNNELHQQIINLRQERKLKLPDAIIAGCSIYKNCTLITADKKILEINGLDVLSYKVI
ncbi:PilT-like protein [Beggiatoa sp. PS]|nr:PilT-like protein [Beggiatoa sp. PS]